MRRDRPSASAALVSERPCLSRHSKNARVSSMSRGGKRFEPQRLSAQLRSRRPGNAVPPFADLRLRKFVRVAQSTKRAVAQNGREIDFGARAVGPAQRDASPALWLSPRQWSASCLQRSSVQLLPFGHQHRANSSAPRPLRYATPQREPTRSINSPVSMPTEQRKPGPST